MRKAIFAVLMLFSSLFMGLQANASNLSSANIFAGLTQGMTATIDRGGSLHSQARSIYSLGGGMVTAQGKRVSLLAADPPSFSAGCSGISWHFGGFSFISMDEIRQLVTAVAQASLGVAIDLAMQVLCPQCYAVMTKLRDIANMMRNAAADACKIAQNLGRMAMDALQIEVPEKRQTTCSSMTAEKGLSAGFLNSAASSLCNGLNGMATAMKSFGDEWLGWMQGKPGAKTPSEESKAEYGNMTYRTLTALGFADGVAKDILMSAIGITISLPGSYKNCSTIMVNVNGTPVSAFDTDNDLAIETSAKTVAGTDPKAADGDTKRAVSGEATSGTASSISCNLPPLISSMKDVSRLLMCGPNATANINRFAAKHSITPEAVAGSSIGILCNTGANKDTSGNYLPTVSGETSSKVPVYSCRETKSVKDGEITTAECLQPKRAYLSEILDTTAGSNQFDGLAFMIADALYNGAIAVRNGTKELDPDTIRILNNSNYPLYRLINLAAVYPGVSKDILTAYAATISVHYVMDTLDRLIRIGAQPNINVGTNVGVGRADISDIRNSINNMIRITEGMKDQSLNRLDEKRALVNQIIQINKGLQAEVMSKGLSGNMDLAVSLRRQYTTKESKGN